MKDRTFLVQILNSDLIVIHYKIVFKKCGWHFIKFHWSFISIFFRNEEMKTDRIGKSLGRKRNLKGETDSGEEEIKRYGIKRLKERERHKKRKIVSRERNEEIKRYGIKRLKERERDIKKKDSLKRKKWRHQERERERERERESYSELRK